jgi:hypothetical protein
MQTYDLNNRSVEPLSATPSDPTILEATTDVQPICTICRKPFPRVLSKVSGLPFQRCQPCNYKARNPTVATAPTVPTPAQVITAQGQLKKAQAVLDAQNARRGKSSLRVQRILYRSRKHQVLSHLSRPNTTQDRLCPSYQYP